MNSTPTSGRRVCGRRDACSTSNSGSDSYCSFRGRRPAHRAGIDRIGTCRFVAAHRDVVGLTRARPPSGRVGPSAPQRQVESASDVDAARRTRGDNPSGRSQIPTVLPCDRCRSRSSDEPSDGSTESAPSQGRHAASLDASRCALFDEASGLRTRGGVMASINEHESAQIDRANASAKPPAIFIHGLWLLPSSWNNWAKLFEDAGYTALTPGWPDDPETVGEAQQHPEAFARKSVGQVADHFGDVTRKLDGTPVVIGHSFGGLLAQILAGRGVAKATVAIDPAPFRGVLPLPISALKAASPALANPANRHRAVPLTYEQFRYAFANAVGEEEAKQLYDTYCVPASGAPIFQAAAANLNPWTEVKVKSKNPDRGPLLIISGEQDHTVPPAIANASYKKQKRNKGVTELTQMPGRGHSLTIDHGWREVADTALTFVQRFA